MKSIETRLAKIEERNRRVEADKAWEISWARRGSVAVTTYVIVVIFLVFINNERPFINALVPSIGYLLSTLALYNFKRAWIQKRTLR